MDGKVDMKNCKNPTCVQKQLATEAYDSELDTEAPRCDCCDRPVERLIDLVARGDFG